MKLISCFCLSFLSVGFLEDHVRIVVNRTDSVSHKIFIHLVKQKASLGDYTLFFNPFNNKKVIKKIVGLEGYKLKYDDWGQLFLEEKKIGKPYLKNSLNTFIHPLPKGVIPKNYVFLYGSHDKSFDSRYAEFGLIHKNRLQGRLIPVI